MKRINPSFHHTIFDVAQLAGVSITTVSRIVNNVGSFPASTVERVNKAVAELNYIPRSTARGLATQRTNTIGLVINEISAPFYPPLLTGLERVVREAGYNFLIYCSEWHDGAGHPRLRPFGAHNTDGLILSSGVLADEEIQSFLQILLPMILINHHPPAGMKIPYLIFDNYSGAKRLVDHLIEVHQRRRIVFLRGPQNEEDSYWREQGYRHSLTGHNIPVDERMIGMGAFDEYVACRTIQEMINDGLDFDAVFAGDDEAAMGAIHCMDQAGVHIPEQVAVVGFDDIDFVRYLTPALTTVHSPILDAGRIAGQMLIDLIRTGQTAQEVILPVELAIRKSCGC